MTNEQITYRVLQACLDVGARDFIVCAGSRNSSFVEALRVEERLSVFYWPEERSGAFFALGRSKLSNRPTVIITTSGTAAGELLPATMEAHYSGVPLILVTADRPRRFRGSGAPQSAEQLKLFGQYTKIALDITDQEPSSLDSWDRLGPAHINVCLEEPQSQPRFAGKSLAFSLEVPQLPPGDITEARQQLDIFFAHARRPMAIVSSLKESDKEAVVNLLTALRIPTMVDAPSGLRQDPRLQPFAITMTDRILETASENGYEIDSVLRIGGIPTHRIWRDLEYKREEIKVCGLSDKKFSGLSWSRRVACGSISAILKGYRIPAHPRWEGASQWIQAQQEHAHLIHALLSDEPHSELAIMRTIADLIPQKAHVYLGDSLPIREWDLVATREDRDWLVSANRGVNGIDGQLSTFLGMCRQDRENWGIFGDLTTLYDLVSCWALPTLKTSPITFVVINNGGGKLFQRMYPYKEMLNSHQITFEHWAKMWGLEYARWEGVPTPLKGGCHRLLEVIPDDAATLRFWEEYNRRKAAVPTMVVG